MDYFIITGASRGVGAALVRRLMRPGNSIFCVARTVNDDLIAESEKLDVELHWIQVDLREREGLVGFMQQVSRSVDAGSAELVCLINNAATLEPVGPVGMADGDDGAQARADAMAGAVGVNLVAPMVLTHLFVAHFGKLDCERVVINVSSGAAERAMPGLSTYCATKAGLNMFTSAAASEASGPRPVRFYAVSPGTVDTDMQAELRSAGPERLRDHDRYVQWKQEGALDAPPEAARRILSLLARPDVASGSYVHAQDL